MFEPLTAASGTENRLFMYARHSFLLSGQKKAFWCAGGTCKAIPPLCLFPSRAHEVDSVRKSPRGAHGDGKTCLALCVCPRPQGNSRVRTVKYRRIPAEHAPFWVIALCRQSAITLGRKCRLAAFPLLGYSISSTFCYNPELEVWNLRPEIQRTESSARNLEPEVLRILL